MAPTSKQRHQQSHPLTVSIADAKANFSSIISRVEQKHSPVTILRRGKPVAQIVPSPEIAVPSFVGSMIGTVKELGDIVNRQQEEWTVSPWPEPDPDAQDD